MLSISVCRLAYQVYLIYGQVNIISGQYNISILERINIIDNLDAFMWKVSSCSRSQFI